MPTGKRSDTDRYSRERPGASPEPVRIRLLDESLALFRRIGDNSNIAVSLMDSALAALVRGDHGRVLALCEASLGLLRKAGDKQHIADCLEIMAGGARGAARRDGRPVAARKS